MNVSVPKETAGGERRVALVPEVVERLAKKGLEVTLEAGAGDSASHLDSAYEKAGAVLGDGFAGPVVAKVAPPSARGDRSAGARVGARRLPLPTHRPRDRARTCRGRGHELRDGGDPADHARPVDGRALLAGHRRGLPRGAGRRPGAAALLSDAHDRRGHGAPGQGARAGRRRGGAPGDRHRAPARRGRLGLRRAFGGEGADRVARRSFPRARHGPRGRRGRGRLRAAAHRRGADQAARAACRSRSARWTPSSRPPRSPAAARRCS